MDSERAKDEKKRELQQAEETMIVLYTFVYVRCIQVCNEREKDKARESWRLL